MNQALIRGFQVQGGAEEAANSKPPQWLKGVIGGVARFGMVDKTRGRSSGCSGADYGC
jgi:hypothetical protein